MVGRWYSPEVYLLARRWSVYFTVLRNNISNFKETLAHRVFFDEVSPDAHLLLLRPT